MKKQQSGFTLIELIMVIVVLGILAAFAIPKFANLGEDARKATLQGAYGSIKSAAALTHSAWLAKNDPTASSVAVEGNTSVTMVASSGYPTNTSVADIAGLGTDFVEVAAGTAGIPTGAIAYAPKGVSTANHGNCMVTYAAPAATAGAVPSIGIVNTDCK